MDTLGIKRSRRETGSHNLLSFVIAYSSSFLFFCDPRVLFRVLFIDNTIALIAALAMASISLLLPLHIQIVSGMKISRYGMYIFLFGAASALRYAFAGVNPLFIVQVIMPCIGILVASIYIEDDKFRSRLFNAFTIAMFLHLFSILTPFQFMKQGIINQTLYLERMYDINNSLALFTTRANGFTSAPGYLSLLSVIGITVGITLWHHERLKVHLLMIVVSFLCGIASGNRSFVVGVCFALLMLPIILGISIKSITTWLVYIFAGVSMFFVVIAYTPYGYILGLRFETITFTKAVEMRASGEAGLVPTFKSIMKNLPIGSIAINPLDGGIQGVWNGMEVVQPHNGIAYIFATRGIILGGIFSLWTIVSLFRLYRARQSKDRKQSYHARAFFGALLVGSIVCVLDPLLETYIMLIPMVFGLTLRRSKASSFVALRSRALEQSSK